MERLSIDEVIAHCKKHVAQVEERVPMETLEEGDMTFTAMKQYWEHRQTAQWLEELKRYREKAHRGLLLDIELRPGDVVYTISGDEIIPLTIATTSLLDNGLDYFGTNTKLSKNKIPLHPDRHGVMWYKSMAEAAAGYESKNKSTPLRINI